MDEIDLFITKKIYNIFNNKWSSNITEIFGVIPYEIYEKRMPEKLIFRTGNA